jgi:type II secretory ATPase GspE/PulE/Tfp pilus assembly ATPase PilB-like protein
VVFEAEGGTDQQNQANIITARQSPGYVPAKELVFELIRQRADKGMLDYNSDAVAVRFQIDGVWHESEAQDRDTGDAILAVFKKMANLNVEERQKRQVGRFSAEFEKRNYQAMIISQGTQTGERVVLQLDRPHSDFKSLRELGMREKMEEQLKNVLSQETGLVLISSPPAGGLTTTVRLALGLTDRYMRDVVSFQAKSAHEPMASNIETTTYNQAAGDVPEKMLESLLRKEPNVVVVSELPNATCAQILCEHAAEERLVVTTVRAKEAVEALLRVLLLKVPSSKFAPAIKAVLNQRLIRVLCDECKQSYEPAPQLLQKLGIPAGRIDFLFRPPEPSEQEKVCQRCNGIGYFGRTAIFELLLVNDEIRRALEKQPKLEVLRQVSKKAGNRNLQQEGIVLVAQGTTSVQELSRVLKQQ